MSDHWLHTNRRQIDDEKIVMKLLEEAW